jgi:hypothetical protein
LGGNSARRLLVPQVQSKSELWKLRATVFFILYAFFATPLYFLGIRSQLALSKRGAQVVGHIVAIEPDNHQSIRYEYQVDGISYAGITGLWPLKDVRIGDPVSVTYLPDQRDVSTAGTPMVEGWWQLLFVVLPIFAGFGALFAGQVGVASGKRGVAP